MGPEPGYDRPPRPRRHSRRRGRRQRPPWLLLLVRILLALLVVFVLVVGRSVGQALVAPGGGTFSERIAEWARGHYLNPLVTLGEWITYQAPKQGGKPDVPLTGPSAGSANEADLSRLARHHGSGGVLATLAGPLAPHRLSSPAGRPLPHEGVWRVLGTVHGVPAIYGTYLRPDAIHTSYLAGLVWMNQQLLRFELRPGAEDPGTANWGTPAWIPPGTRRGLLATFNGGFRIASAQGGFYLNGITRGTLEDGAASMVYYRNGRLTVGVWGRSVRMTKSVVGVRQNLKLIVQNGRVPSTVDSNVETSWGATLGGGYYVWRSGVGVTRTGRVVFVYGPALNVRDLAELLRRAGCVSAMQLDINPDWMSFMYYLTRHHPANPTPINLLQDQMQPAYRYYSIANRDFTAVYAR